MILADDVARPSWQCIHFAGAAEVHRALDSLPDANLRILSTDVHDVQNEQQLLARVAGTMHFPDYFGANRDALEECLRDLEWLPARGYVLILEGATALWQSAPQDAGKFIESWLLAAREWSREGVAFHLVFAL
jgi:hypothetical protein